MVNFRFIGLIVVVLVCVVLLVFINTKDLANGVDALRGGSGNTTTSYVIPKEMLKETMKTIDEII